jgi:hypothetical protein
MVASNTAFKCVYNNCFHHEMNFLSFGTQVQYQHFGLLQYLISHRLSHFYLEEKSKTFRRKLRYLSNYRVSHP